VSTRVIGAELIVRECGQPPSVCRTSEQPHRSQRFELVTNHQNRRNRHSGERMYAR
jgi:hypothetical protein